MALIVTENGEVEGAWNMVFLVLRRRADVDDIREICERKRWVDVLGEFHVVLRFHLDNEADFDGDAEG